MAMRPLFLGIVAAATAAVLVPMTVLGLPYQKFDPESFAHQYTLPKNGNETHLHIDADITNGTRPCDPIDSTTRVQVGVTHKVGVCLETYQPNAVNNFELHIRYAGDPDADPPTMINIATEVADAPPALDDNPDANDGDDPAGFMLGGGWDCSTFGIVFPKGEDPLTPGVADAIIVCNASLAAPDQDLAGDPGLLATIEFTANSPGIDLIDFGPIDGANLNSVVAPRLGGGVARCGTSFRADRVACFGATIEKVVFECLWADDFGRGTSLGFLGDQYEFSFPGGMIGGTGHVIRVGNLAVVFGTQPGGFAMGVGTCPDGPARGFAVDLSGFPVGFFRLEDATQDGNGE